MARSFGDLRAGRGRPPGGCFLCGKPTEATVSVQLREKPIEAGKYGVVVATRQRSVCEGCGVTLYEKLLDRMDPSA